MKLQCRPPLVLTDADKKYTESWLHRRVRVEFRKDRGIDVDALTIVGPLPKIKFRLITRATAPGP